MIFFRVGLRYFQGGGWEIFGGGGGVEKFLGGGVEKFSGGGGFEKFSGGRVENFFGGGVRNFTGGYYYFGGGGLNFLGRGDIFSGGVGNILGGRVDIFSGGVGNFSGRELFGRPGWHFFGRVDIFSGRVDIFSGGVGIFLGGVEIFSGGVDIGLVISKELKNFPMELGFFEKLRIFKWGVGVIFHNGWGKILGWLELLRGVMFFRFLVDWDFLFLWWRGGGRLIFFQKLKVSHGIKIFPVTWVSCQGVRNFSGGGRGGG